MAVASQDKAIVAKVSPIFEVDDSHYSHHSSLKVPKNCETLHQKTTDYFKSFKT